MANKTANDFVATMSGEHAAKLARLREVTEYVGAPTERIDNYLGVRLLLQGIVRQTVTLSHDRDDSDEETANIAADVEPQTRVIVKVLTPDGKQHFLSFTSVAITSWVEQYLIPEFGEGNFAEPVPVKVLQASTRRGNRTYNVQVVE